MSINAIGNNMVNNLSFFGFGLAFFMMNGMRMVPMMTAGNPPAATTPMAIPSQPPTRKILQKTVVTIAINVMNGAK